MSLSPLRLLEAAGRCGVDAAAVSLLLAYAECEERRLPMPSFGDLARQLSVKPDTIARWVGQLAEAGVVTVDRQPGKPAAVALVRAVAESPEKWVTRKTGHPIMGSHENREGQAAPQAVSEECPENREGTPAPLSLSPSSPTPPTSSIPIPPTPQAENSSRSDESEAQAPAAVAQPPLALVAAPAEPSAKAPTEAALRHEFTRHLGACLVKAIEQRGLPVLWVDKKHHAALYRVVQLAERQGRTREQITDTYRAVLTAPLNKWPMEAADPLSVLVSSGGYTALERLRGKGGTATLGGRPVSAITTRDLRDLQQQRRAAESLS